MRGLDAATACVLQGFGDEDTLEILGTVVENLLFAAIWGVDDTMASPSRQLLRFDDGITLYTM